MVDFNYQRLADFGAAISVTNKLLCQGVLEELDVRVISEYPFYCIWRGGGGGVSEKKNESWECPFK